MNAKLINESLMLCDVFGGVGQDVIVRLKYPKYITLYFGEQNFMEIADMIRKGHYYRGSEKDKFKPCSLDVQSGIKTKLRTYIYRRNYIDPDPEKAEEIPGNHRQHRSLGRKSGQVWVRSLRRLGMRKCSENSKNETLYVRRSGLLELVLPRSTLSEGRGPLRARAKTTTEYKSGVPTVFSRSPSHARLADTRLGL